MKLAEFDLQYPVEIQSGQNRIVLNEGAQKRFIVIPVGVYYCRELIQQVLDDVINAETSGSYLPGFDSRIRFSLLGTGPFNLDPTDGLWTLPLEVLGLKEEVYESDLDNQVVGHRAVAGLWMVLGRGSAETFITRRHIAEEWRGEEQYEVFVSDQGAEARASWLQYQRRIQVRARNLSAVHIWQEADGLASWQHGFREPLASDLQGSAGFNLERVWESMGPYRLTRYFTDGSTLTDLVRIADPDAVGRFDAIWEDDEAAGEVYRVSIPFVAVNE